MEAKHAFRSFSGSDGFGEEGTAGLSFLTVKAVRRKGRGDRVG